MIRDAKTNCAPIYFAIDEPRTYSAHSSNVSSRLLMSGVRNGFGL